MASLALVYSVGACVVSVALEAMFAGSGIKQRLNELRVPRYVPPLWGWVVIGALYYVICFLVIYRVLSMDGGGGLRVWSLWLVGGIMFTNALWNYFFFRSRNLFHAFVIGIPYSAFAVLLFAILFQFDRLAAWFLFPYLVYLFYANWFGYRVWKLS